MRSDFEPVPHRVLRYSTRLDELQQVVRAARLGARAGQPVAAERLAADHRPGDPAVDVQIPDRGQLPHAANGARIAREEATGQRERKPIHHLAGMLDVADRLDGQYGPEDLLL